VGAQDPNPAHAGRGVRILRDAGIDVVNGVLADVCDDLNIIFNHWITRETPMIAAKMALTLDGKFASASGQAKWVTGEAARADVMRWRRYFPSIAVSARTVMADDPSLTARLETEIWCPLRLVFDGLLSTLSLESLPKLYTDPYADRTLIVCRESAPVEARKRADELGLRVWCLPEKDGYFDWAALRQRCASEGVFGIYVETGPRLATVMLEAGLADYCFVYQAPKFLSDAASPGIGTERNTQSMDAALCLKDLRFEQFGEDRLTRGFIEK
jgi:diaminohydroxyphosphoribosylaminopyrimidine deaminase/5-amino-6-(5-phosphoribosylamino)uracil reductase